MTSPMATLTAPTLLSLDEQVIVLRQGIECGDATLARSMASDLREAPWERGTPPEGLHRPLTAADRSGSGVACAAPAIAASGDLCGQGFGLCETSARGRATDLLSLRGRPASCRPSATPADR
jgi:hypothetical protein